MKHTNSHLAVAASAHAGVISRTVLTLFVLSVAASTSAQTPHQNSLIRHTLSSPGPAAQANQQQAALAPEVTPSKAPESLTFTFDTMDFPGSHASMADKINDKGQVAGRSAACLIAGETCPNRLAAGPYGFRMSGSSFAKLSFPGASQTGPVGINKSSDIVGIYMLPDNSIHGFLLAGKTYTSLDYPGAAYSYSLAINDSGQIVGNWNDGAGTLHGYVYSSGVFTSIDPPGSLYTEADGIDKAGDIVGLYCDGVACRGYLLHSGVFTIIDYPGATSTGVYGINDKGQMVGAYGTGAIVQNFDQQHGFLYDGSTFTSFDAPFGGVVVTWARGINNKSQIVGFYEDNTLSDFGFLASFK
jgi:uncharacterized membrane protein